MRLTPLIVGVDTRPIFRFQKVVVRFSARPTGSPSWPALAGKRSTSSQSTTRIGREARLAGALAPVMVRRPPGNAFCKIVSLESLALPENTALRTSVSRIIGATRSLENASAISTVGCTMRIGAGSP
jgi:hypothetical protein